MKKLQNNFTTPEQSKRLLELGVPADSADMLWDGSINANEGWIFEDFPFYCENPFSYYQLLYRETDAVNILPCWSVGRLIEIAKICSKSRYALRGLFLFLDECEADECMSQVMDYFEICNYQFDFSKLEE